ncbi:MAG: IS66 family insertion sequence element accessory protein TnpB [Gammaproteobacteria bacterium]|nr:IS66 family insertion sequence element accessory protein TnpB [Gammaproteobacteria bacterium]
MRGRVATGTGRRRRTSAWQALVEGFGASGLTLAQYCAREGIGMASYHRWRRLLSAPRRRAVTTRPASSSGMTRAEPVTPAFVDLGALPGTSSRLELRLDLGGGVILQIARG